MSTALQNSPRHRHPISEGRLYQIDALRGIAALLVLIYHTSASLSSFAIRYGHKPVLDQFARDVDFGRMGVMIFFIVSGFVVAHALDSSNATLRNFAVRRFFRLYPLYWFSILLVAVFLKGRNYLVKPTAEMDTIFANVTMLPTVLGFEPLMTLYWTLETELIFYFAAATVYRMGYLFQLKALFAGICLLICIFAAMIFGVVPAPHLMSWQSLPLNLAFMFWGTSFYAVFAKQNMPLDQPYRKYFLLLSAAAILSPSIYTLGRYFFTHSPDDFRWAVSYPSAFFIFLLTFFVNSRFTRIFASLGLISYSMYLLHPTAISIFSLVLERFPLNGSMSSLSVLTALSIAFTIVLSTSSYLFLEKPFIELGQKLTKKRSHVFNI